MLRVLSDRRPPTSLFLFFLFLLLPCIVPHIGFNDPPYLAPYPSFSTFPRPVCMFGACPPLFGHRRPIRRGCPLVKAGPDERAANSSDTWPCPYVRRPGYLILGT